MMEANNRVMMNRNCYFALCILLIPMLAGQSLFAQPGEAPYKAYKAAFDYVKEKYKGRKLWVNDTLIHLEFSNFYNELSPGNKAGKFAMLKLLDSVDHSRQTYAVKYPKLKSFETGGKAPALVIYFSDRYDNMLIAEVIIKSGEDLNHYPQSFSKQSTQYLFLFDDKSRIKKVFEQRLQYE